MTKVSLERIADTLFPQPQKGNSTAYGSVESVNADGSYQVKLNASSTTTRAARLCDASAGDRVLVLIQANGHCAAIGRVGGNGGGPVVLYDDASGTTGTVTLSSSAANFEHMRIYFKKNGDTNACGSTDIYQPNGKNASLVLANSWSTSGMQFMGAIVSISGTAITRYRNEIYGNTNTSPQIGTSSSFSVAITRVEAW